MIDEFPVVLRKVEAALRRSFARALELGLRTNTPVLILRDGKIVDLTAEANQKDEKLASVRREMEERITRIVREAANGEPKA